MFRYLYIDQVSSTNDYAKELGLQGDNNIAVIAKAREGWGAAFPPVKIMVCTYLSFFSRKTPCLFLLSQRSVFIRLSRSTAEIRYLLNGPMIFWLK